MTDQALACLDMMDFDGKDFVMNKISQNGVMYDRLQQMQQLAMLFAGEIDSSMGTNYQAQVAQASGGNVAIPNGVPEIKNSGEESAITAKARERTASLISP